MASECEAGACSPQKLGNNPVHIGPNSDVRMLTVPKLPQGEAGGKRF